MSGRATEKRRERLTTVPRLLLEQMRDHGPQTPPTLMRARTYASMAERGLCQERADGSFAITPNGLDALESKMGRPTKMTGDWLALVEHYGGPEKFSSQVGVSYVTVNRWSLHTAKPSGSSLNLVRRLAKEAGLPDPFARSG